MIDRLPPGLARQRIGTALSRQLLGALRAPWPHGTTAPTVLAAAPPRGGTNSEPPLLTDGGTQHSWDVNLAARPALPEAHEFRVYSPLGNRGQDVPPMEEVEVGYHPMATEDENQPEVSTDELTGVPELLSDPPRRRSWLLAKALETHPLDQALDLARHAEAFITGTAAVAPGQAGSVSEHPEPPSSTAEAQVNRASPKTQRPRLGLRPEERDRLLERLAQGARNAELASEFNLSPKQVQGIRIGSAREISRRRNTPSHQQ
jgi:hypothetical protein